MLLDHRDKILEATSDLISNLHIDVIYPAGGFSLDGDVDVVAINYRPNPKNGLVDLNESPGLTLIV